MALLLQTSDASRRGIVGDHTDGHLRICIFESLLEPFGPLATRFGGVESFTVHEFMHLCVSYQDVTCHRNHGPLWGCASRRLLQMEKLHRLSGREKIVIVAVQSAMLMMSCC
jgi:hypothetical protein